MRVCACKKNQTGVGLIEVLVAVLVLSIGFLGVAALEARSLSTNNSAMARSVATMATYSILDAMRADAVNAKANKYDGSVTADSCPAAGTTLATTQINQWCGELAKDFGAVSTTVGSIACDAAGSCQVTIKYDDSRAGWGYAPTQTIVTKGIL